MSIYSHEDILKCISDGFFTINSNWEITGLNPVTESHLRMSAQDIVGKRVDLIFRSKKERSKFVSRYRKVMDHKESVTFEGSYEGQHFQISAYPKFDGGMAIFYKDITSEKIKETELKKALEVKSEFLSIASHELKTPLTGLKLQADLAKRIIDKQGPEGLSPNKIKQIINNFHSDINRLKRLVDDMLDISRINTGKLSMNFEYFNFDDLMNEVVERLKLTFPQFDKLVSTSLYSPALVRWDSLRIEQVITNLLSNAFRYGEGTPIELVTCYQGSSIIIEVADQGPGIPENIQGRIFERFESSSHGREKSGLGLGLYISRGIVLAHHGTIWVQSAPTPGCRFIVEIPVNPSKDFIVRS